MKRKNWAGFLSSWILMARVLCQRKIYLMVIRDTMVQISTKKKSWI